jgi:hypothetical protein
LRVLLIEDDVDVTGDYLLGRLGHKTEIAHSGLAGLGLARRDRRFATGSGVQLINRAKRRPPSSGRVATGSAAARSARGC